MKIFYHPDKEEWPAILKRPAFEVAALRETVGKILKDVQTQGDAAVLAYSRQFDLTSFNDLSVSAEELDAAASRLAPALKTAIETAYRNILKFHVAQHAPVQTIETMEGVFCSRKSVAIDRVGLYIPGGSAPLFSTVLMLGVPAKLAGCRRIVLCTPPDKTGQVHPAILFAARLVGVDAVFRVGGVQAIAAMAYGTATVPKVDKIFGPGNQYVTAAKQLIQAEGVAIDMPAGPSEVMLITDDEANPDYVAADLLSQAEHGPDSQVILISLSARLVEETLKALARQIETLPRKEIAVRAMASSAAVIIDGAKAAMEMANEYAPEHLILATKDAETMAEGVVNAGSVFIGGYSPESVGDYASGTNHTLPTNGYARAYSGVSLDSFVKKITFQRLTPDGLRAIGPTVMEMARAELLEAHARAVEIRLKDL